MQKRIDYLNKKLEPIIDRMRGYPAFDIQGYNELLAQRLVLQNEINWLTEIQQLLPLRIESDSYDEQYHQVEIRLTFPPLTIVSPLNKWVYDIADRRSTGMNTLQIERMGYQFTYTDFAIGKTPPQMVAEQITQSYIHAAKSLDDMVTGIYFANIALHYFNTMQRTGFGYPVVDKNLEYAANLAHHILRYEGEELEILDNAARDDSYLSRLKETAKGYWPTTRRLIAFTLLEGRYNIDWQPFGMGLATSR